MNVIEDIFTIQILRETFITLSTLKGMDFSEMILDTGISTREIPPLALPQFYKLIPVLMYVLSAHLILLHLLYSLLNFCDTQRSSVFLTNTVMIITTHSFKNSFTVIANSVYTATIERLLSTSSNITLNSTTWSSSIKK